MAEIIIAIEGDGATAAAQEFVTMQGLEARWETEQEVVTRGDVAAIITIIGGVIGAAKGALEIAEQIRKWHEEWKKGKQSKRIKKAVLILPDNRRLQLENASVAELAAALEKLPKK